MSGRSYSLAEVAAAHLPAEWKNPELWLKRRLRRREIGGYKVGHTWRMRESDVEAMLDRYSNQASDTAVSEPVAPSESITAGLSARGARRLRSA